MPLYIRAAILVALVLGAIAVLVPGVVRDGPLPLEVGLQGGTEMQLEMDWDVATATAVEDDADFLRREGEELRMVVRQRGVDRIEVESGAPVGEVVEFVDYVLLGFYRHVRSDGQVHRFQITEERATKVRELALERTEVTLRQRLDCVEGLRLERVAPNTFHLELPNHHPLDCVTGR